MVQHVPRDPSGGIARRPAVGHGGCPGPRRLKAVDDVIAHGPDGGEVVERGLSVPDADLARVRRLGAQDVFEHRVAVTATAAGTLAQPLGCLDGHRVQDRPGGRDQGGVPASLGGGQRLGVEPGHLAGRAEVRGGVTGHLLDDVELLSSRPRKGIPAAAATGA